MSKDTRCKNYDWDVNSFTPMGRGVPALLMDIREELQKLNALLHCRNFVGIPVTLRKIEANTKPRKRVKKPKIEVTP